VGRGAQDVGRGVYHTRLYSHCSALHRLHEENILSWILLMSRCWMRTKELSLTWDLADILIEASSIGCT
jgi:hypothetical protein